MIEPAPLRDNLLIRLAGDQRAVFVVVGGINTVLGLSYLVALQLTLGRVANYLVVLVVAHVVQVLSAFTLHRRLVFKVRGHLWLDLWRFELVNLGALGVTAVLLVVGVEVVGMPVLVAQLLSMIVVITSSFVLHRAFSFHRTPEQVAAQQGGDGAEARRAP